MIFPSNAENHENVIFTLSVFMKMLFSMQCGCILYISLCVNLGFFADFSCSWAYSKEKPNTGNLKKTAFSLKSYWTIFRPLIHFFHPFSKLFCDKDSVITYFESFYYLLFYYYVLLFYYCFATLLKKMIWMKMEKGHIYIRICKDQF